MVLPNSSSKELKGDPQKKPSAIVKREVDWTYVTGRGGESPALHQRTQHDD